MQQSPLSHRGWQAPAAWQALLMAALFAVGGYLLFANLGATRIMDYDEARHGVNAYEMIQNDDYLVQTYGGEPDYWNLKTPLSFWSIALSYRLFGYNAFALRFYSALSALLSMAAIACWAVRRFGWTPALVALGVFVCNQGLYGNHFARFGDADAQYQLFFTLSMLCMLMGRENFKWFYGAAFCFALAFMVKAAHAATIPVICALFVLCTGQWKRLNWKRALLLMAWGLAPIAAWAAARYSRDGTAFLVGMVKTDVVDRVGGSAFLSNISFDKLWYYLNAIFKRPALIVGLALCVVCAALAAAGRVRLTTACKDALIGTLLWLFVPVILYTLTGAGYLWYVYSGFMAMPALTAVMVRAAQDAPGKRGWLRLSIGAAAVALCVIGLQLILTAPSQILPNSYQEVVREYLDRETDSGMHLYVQYNEEENGSPIVRWTPGDRLAAVLAGDVTCLDGGAAAFDEDEEGAMLLIGLDNNRDEIDRLMGYCIARSFQGRVYLLEK